MMFIAIIILMAILGVILLAWIAVTATPRDKDEYERYMRYKERKHGHGKDRTDGV